MKELLEELISKFNSCKEGGLNYHTYKDKELDEAFARAEKFLKKGSKKGEAAPESAETKPE